jgi:exosome complex RNA-binding protein Rrp42 (RNase PH superfamily)
MVLQALVEARALAVTAAILLSQIMPKSYRLKEAALAAMAALESVAVPMATAEQSKSKVDKSQLKVECSLLASEVVMTATLEQSEF